MMTILACAVFAGFALFVLVSVLNKKAAKNIISAVRSQVGEVGRAAKDADPLTNLKQAVEDGETQIEASRQSIVSIQSLIRTNSRLLENLHNEETVLSNRITNAKKKGSEQEAIENAKKLLSVRKRIEKMNNTLDKNKKQYEDFVATVNENQKKVSDARENIKNLGLDLELSQRQRELASLKADSVDLNFEEAAEAVQRKIDENMAHVDVANDTNPHDNDSDDVTNDEDIQQILNSH